MRRDYRTNTDNHAARVILMAERYANGQDIWTGETTEESESEFFRNMELTDDETADTMMKTTAA